MTNTHAGGPRPAFVEDYDDDNNTVISSTREVAKAARNPKDGSDSGYSSRTGTVDGDNHGMKRGMADVKISSLPIERQRNPYSSTAAIGRRESIHEQKPTSRPSAAPRADAESKKYCHPKGVCYSCDRLGYHLTQEEVDAIRDQISNGVVVDDEKPAPSSKQHSGKIKQLEPEKKTKRMSLQTGPRPAVTYPPSATRAMPAMYAAPDPYQAGYVAGPGLTMFAPVQPAYSLPQTPITPSTPQRGLQQADMGYFGAPDINSGRAIPRHRNSMHAGTDIPRGGYDSYDYAQPESFLPSRSGQARSHSRPRPQQTSSYNDIDHHYGRQMYEDDSRQKYPSSQQHHSDQVPNHGPLTVRTRNLSPQRRHAALEDDYAATRPKPRHSISDYPPAQSTAKYSTRQDHIPRRATQPTTAVDAKLAVAEAYQEKQGGITSGGLSANKVKQSASSHAHTRSETGSNHSHRDSHYSSSKASTQSKRARRESIVIETSGSRPLSISIPNGPTVTIGTGSSKSSKKGKEPKLIEHAPSSVSTASRTSASRSRAATSSYTSSDRGREREHGYKTLRRISHVIDSNPPSSPVKTSSKPQRTSSRAPSRSRASTEGEGRRR